MRRERGRNAAIGTSTCTSMHMCASEVVLVVLHYSKMFHFVFPSDWTGGLGGCSYVVLENALRSVTIPAWKGKPYPLWSAALGCSFAQASIHISLLGSSPARRFYTASTHETSCSRWLVTQCSESLISHFSSSFSIGPFFYLFPSCHHFYPLQQISASSPSSSLAQTIHDI